MRGLFALRRNTIPTKEALSGALRHRLTARPSPERFIDAHTSTLSALGFVHFVVFGKEHWAIGAFLRTWFRQLPDTGQAPCGGPGTPAALTGRSGSRS